MVFNNVIKTLDQTCYSCIIYGTFLNITICNRNVPTSLAK